MLALSHVRGGYSCWVLLTQLWLLSLLAAVADTHPLQDLESKVTTDPPGCHYKDVVYPHGEVVTVEDLCVSCVCRAGTLDCAQTVCADLPNELPAGCAVVRQPQRCCADVECGSDTEEQSRLEEGACLINGSVYTAGSALNSSSPCEFCYCINQSQVCTQPTCVPPRSGCVPGFKDHACCPTHYDCGCFLEGLFYPEGDRMPSPDKSPCETCYCLKGKLKCTNITCPGVEFSGCNPVFTPGQCCPTSYTCRRSTDNSGRSYQDGETTTLLSTSVPETTTTELSITVTDSAIETTTFISEEETTEAANSSEKVTLEDSTTTVTTSVTQTETTTSVTSITTEAEATPVPTATSVETTKLSSETLRPGIVLNIQHRGKVEASDDIINVTLQGKVSLGETVNSSRTPLEEPVASSPEDYDYDYTDPKLPPSLPNLVIFPFVAADAVVKDKGPSTPDTFLQGPVKRTDDGGPVYYKDLFTPPAETEGGFVPRDPTTLEDPTYESNFSKAQSDPPLLESPLEPPSITMPPKLKSENCLSEGKEYMHGDLLSEPGECTSCVCFYGEVICQEALCPAVVPGCHRTTEKELSSCCGKVICDDEKSQLLSPPLNQLPVTVADIIDVTPDPFRDVIRTEPAPDLPTLINDHSPFYPDQKPVKTSPTDFPDIVITTTGKEDTSRNPVYYFKNNSLTTTELPVVFTDSPELSTTSLPSEDNTTTETIRTSIRHVVIETTEPIRQPLTSEVPVIERFKVTTKRPLISIRPKATKATSTSTPPTTEESFLEFFKELLDEKTMTTTETTLSTTIKVPVTTKHKYSSKVRSTKPSFTKTTTEKPFYEGKNEFYQKLNDDEIREALGNDKDSFHDDSFSLDSVLKYFFDSDSSTATTPTVKVTSRPKLKNQTKKANKKPQTRRTTKLPSSSTTLSSPTTQSTTTTTSQATAPTLRATTPNLRITTSYIQSRHGSNEGGELSFVTDHDTGFPRINILHQGGYMKPHSARKPTKTSQDLGSILKLAGCNIYGRMYRVGKVITELSGPCLECKCTELGVQCSQLVC